MSRLNILFTPSVREGPWVDGIREAAAAKGLSVAYWGEGEADILVCHHLPFDKVAGLDAREWVVLADTPEAALVSYGDAYKEYPPGPQSLMAAAARFAVGAWMAERGAPVLGQPAMALSLPGLGLTSPRKIDVPTYFAGPRVSALSLYERLPVRIGAATVWGPENFSFPVAGQRDGGLARIDLTGRDRLLMDGPYLVLPPGLWRATLKMAIDPQGREAPLSFDWGEAHDMVTVDETVEEPGFYSVSLDRLFRTPGTTVLRISLTQPLFQGVLEVIDCTVERLPDPEPKLPLEA